MANARRPKNPEPGPRKIARSVVDVILGEAAFLATTEERFQDMRAIASVIANRARRLHVTPEEVVSAVKYGRKQFDAYDDKLPEGAEQYRKLAELAWEDVRRAGPITGAMYYATPAVISKFLEKNPQFQQVGETVGHVYFEDPANKPIVTARRTIEPDLEPRFRPRTQTPMYDTGQIGALAPGAAYSTMAQPSLVGRTTADRFVKLRDMELWSNPAWKSYLFDFAEPAVASSETALPDHAPVPRPRPEPDLQFEDVPIPAPRPGAVPFDAIDTRSIRGHSLVDPQRLRAAAVPDQRPGFLPGTRPGIATAPAFSPPRDLGRLLGQPAWDGAGLMDMARPDPNATGLYGLQLSAVGGPMLDELSPAERMAAIAASPVPRSNLDYRMAAIAADPNLRQAALESNPTYEAPFALGAGTMFGQIGPEGFAGKPQYGGGLAAIWDPDGYAAEQQRLADIERRVKELSAAAPALPPDRPMPAGPVRPSSVPLDLRVTPEDRLSVSPSSITPAAASRFALGPQAVDAEVRTAAKRGRLMAAPAPARFGAPAPENLRYDFQADLARLAAMDPEVRTAPDQSRFGAAPEPTRFERPPRDDLRYDYQMDLARMTGMDSVARTAAELGRLTTTPMPARFGPPAPHELGFDYETDLARLAALGSEVRTTPKQDRLVAAPLSARFGMPAPDDLQYDYETDLARLAAGPAPAQTVAAPASVAPRPVVAGPTVAPRVEPVVQPQRDQFPPAPQQESLLGALLGPRMGAALLGGAVGGLPGALVGGLLGAFLGGGPGGLLGGNGRIGPATEAERFNAGSGIRGIEQGMYGPRGATGFSRSNPGSYVTSRGPGQGYDLTSGRYGWREHYDANGNFRGISYADGRGLLGGLSRALGGLFGGDDDSGKSGKGRKSEKDKGDEGAGLW